MLSSRTFWYSGVSGACCAGPQALFGSYFITWPPRRRLMACHWPFQFGYFASSAARTPPIVMVNAAASAIAAGPMELWFDMALLPAVRLFCLIAMGQNIPHCAPDAMESVELQGDILP